MTKMSKELEIVYERLKIKDPEGELTNLCVHLILLAKEVEYLVDSMQEIKQKLKIKD